MVCIIADARGLGHAGYLVVTERVGHHGNYRALSRYLITDSYAAMSP